MKIGKITYKSKVVWPSCTVSPPLILNFSIHSFTNKLEVLLVQRNRLLYSPCKTNVKFAVCPISEHFFLLSLFQFFCKMCTCFFHPESFIRRKLTFLDCTHLWIGQLLSSNFWCFDVTSFWVWTSRSSCYWILLTRKTFSCIDFNIIFDSVHLIKIVIRFHPDIWNISLLILMFLL